MPEWRARMIAADLDFAGAPLLRRQFDLDAGHGDVTAARLHLSALGVCEAWLNGAPATEEVLTPGWSSYEWRLRYRTIDVTGLLSSTSVLGVALGNGWYRGRLGWNGDRELYGDELAAWVQLEIDFEDGHTQTVVSDTEWQAGPSDVLHNDLYDGQTIDARLREPSWLEPGPAPSTWTGVHPVDFDEAKLTPYIGPGVVRQEVLSPRKVWTSANGSTLVDFGQNLVGWVRIRVRGEPGSTITLRHAEVIEDGELGTRPLRSALATDHFILSGDEDVFEPTMTFHGFRYLEVHGWPGELDPDDLVAVVVGSDLRRTGDFRCSDPMLNQLHSNVVWGMRGNFLDVPTDCPQRDERLGWTGDISVFAPTAAYLYDVQGFLRDWLADLAAEQQHHDGMIPFVVPDVLKYVGTSELPDQETTAIWSDAGVWVPWALWEAHGDPTVLSDQFQSMAAHARRVRSLLSPNGLWDTGFQFGDWLDPHASPDRPGDAKADRGVIATACAYRTAHLVAQAARVLGRAAEQREFSEMATELRDAFNWHYVDCGLVTSDAPTVYALAIVFGLLEGEDRQRAGDRLANLVAENDFRISTGFAGTPFVNEALTETGHLDDAYRLLLERECPSWLYPVTQGATTVWERWDSMLADGTINPGEMTSFNHYALGAVADWMRRVIGGLAPLEPGYSTILVAPRPGGSLTWAETVLDTRHGRAQVHWTLDGDRLELQVQVPPHTSALIRLPNRPDELVGPGEHSRTHAWPLDAAG